MANEITSFERVSACDLSLSAYFSINKISSIDLGTYGYQNGNHAAALYSYPPLVNNVTFNAESVFYIVGFNGDAYCSLEQNDGKGSIYRAISGTWTKVYDHPSKPLMLHMHVHTDGYLYATTGNIVIRSSNGADWSTYLNTDSIPAGHFSFISVGSDLYMGGDSDVGGGYKPSVYKNTTLDWADTEHPSESFWSGAAFNGDIFFGTYNGADTDGRIVRYSDKSTVKTFTGKGSTFSLIVDTITNTLFAFVSAKNADNVDGGSQVWSTKDGVTWTQIYGTEDSSFLGVKPFFDSDNGDLWVPGGRVNTGNSGYGRIYKSVRYEVPVPSEYVPQYPLVFSSEYVKATSRWTEDEGVGQYYYPWFATDPFKPLTGSIENTTWVSANGATTNQRFHIDLGSSKIIKRIHYQNLAEGRGIYQFTFWGTNDPYAFVNLDYNVDTEWVQLNVSQNTFDYRNSNDTPDPKYIIVNNDIAYRYYAFKFVNARVDEFFMGVRRIELQMRIGGAVLQVNNSSHTIEATATITVTNAYEDGNYTTQYPPFFNGQYVKATTTWTADEEIGEYYYPWFTCDPSKSVIGSPTNNSWISTNGATTDQRFHIDLGVRKIVRRIRYENGHANGGSSRGVFHFTFWGSNTVSAFNELTYGIDTDWKQLDISQSMFDQHASLDVSDPKYIMVTNSTAYRYYAFKFVDTRANEFYMNVRRIELQILGSVENPDYSSEPGLEPQIWSTDLKKRVAVNSKAHFPCGHWHSTPYVPDTACLTYKTCTNNVHATEIGPRSMKIFSNKFLYCFFNGPNAILKKIHSETLILEKQKTFADTDVYMVWDMQEFDGAIYAIVETDGEYGGTGLKGSWVYRFDFTTLAIIDKRVYGETCIGTDGKKYYAIENRVWSDDLHPITGVDWETVWKELPENYRFHVAEWPNDEHPAQYVEIQRAAYDSFSITERNILVLPIATDTWGITKFTLNGERLTAIPITYCYMSNIIISPNRLYAAMMIKLVSTNFIRVFKISDMTYVDGPSQTMYSTPTAYNTSLIWHRNGFIYACYQSDLVAGVMGVVKFDQNGNFMTSYTLVAPSEPYLMGKIVASESHIYWWQEVLGVRPVGGAVGGIIKLNLNLEFVCVEPFHTFGDVEAVHENVLEPFALTIREEKKLIYHCGVAKRVASWKYN